MNRQKYAAFFLCLLIALWGQPCGAEIRFSGLDLSEDNSLLFRADSSGGGAENQNVLLHTRLPDRSVRLLTVFPEKMELIDGGSTLLIHNAFGSHRLPITGGLPQPFPGFPAFSGNSQPGSRVESTAASPDGKWLLYIEASSHARGTLMLLDGTTGKTATVSREIERPGRAFPALWSPDSRGFLYSKGGRLYFYSVNVQSALPDERLRSIGEGAVNSFCWGRGGTFYYFKGSTIYRAQSVELFARILYTSFLDLGQVAGKMPFDFDPNFDNFWIAPDGLSVLVCKGGRNLFYYPLGVNDDTEIGYAALPYVMATRPGARINVLWSANGIATVLIGEHSRVPLIYRLNTYSAGKTFETLESPPDKQAQLSPDGRLAVFWGRTGLYLYDYRAWKLLSRLSSSPVYSCIWLSNDELIIGGEDRIERMRLPGGVPGERELLCLSTVSRFGFEESASAQSSGAPNSGALNSATQNAAAVSRRIAAFTGNNWYVTDGVSPWTTLRVPSVRNAAITSAQYRVYLETSWGFLQNVPMVRNASGVGTFALFETKPVSLEEFSAPLIRQSYARLPDTGETYLFTHGGRGIRELALCFDLYDDAAGLEIVLDALGRFGLTSTFFINGEFIRRNPQAVREIALAGHEAASMFYAPIDLSDSRYRVDKTFITRGLARNEDEYFKATGKELSLFWHPPFYAASREIAAAAAEAGYRTTGRDTDSRDWIRASDARRLSMEQLPAAEMIDAIVDAAEGGSIIPIRLGALEGGRPDYLFNSLEVLLDALIRKGYEVVPVSTLLNKSR